MTNNPKEEAEALIEKFQVIELSPKDDICMTFKAQEIQVAIQCALICCDKIIEELELFNYKLTPLLSERIRFYNQVKQHLSK